MFEAYLAYDRKIVSMKFWILHLIIINVKAGMSKVWDTKIKTIYDKENRGRDKRSRLMILSVFVWLLFAKKSSYDRCHILLGLSKGRGLIYPSITSQKCWIFPTIAI